jgi:hypothetical protein
VPLVSLPRAVSQRALVQVASDSTRLIELEQTHLKPIPTPLPVDEKMRDSDAPALFDLWHARRIAWRRGFGPGFYERRIAISPRPVHVAAPQRLSAWRPGSRWHSSTRRRSVASRASVMGR